MKKCTPLSLVLLLLVGCISNPLWPNKEKTAAPLPTIGEVFFAAQKPFEPLPDGVIDAEWLRVDDGKKPFAVCREFQLKRVPKHAEIWLSSQNACTLTINGQEVLARKALPPVFRDGDAWITRVDISIALKAGTNTLRAALGGGAFLAQMEADGYLMSTDAAWYAESGVLNVFDNKGEFWLWQIPAVSTGTKSTFTCNSDLLNKAWANQTARTPEDAFGSVFYTGTLSDMLWMRQNVYTWLLKGHRNRLQFLQYLSDYYLYTGDRLTVQEAYPMVWECFGRWTVNADGFAVPKSQDKEKTFSLNDPCVDSILYAKALENGGVIALAANQPQEAQAFAQQRQNMIKAINRTYWNGSTYGGLGATNTVGYVDVVAVLCGVPNPTNTVKLAAALKSSTLSPEITAKALLAVGEGDAAFDKLQKADAKELSAELLMKYIAGLSVLEPGGKRFKVAPQPGPLKHLKAQLESFGGSLGIAIENTPARLAMTVTVPNSTTAEVHVPLRPDCRAVRVNGDLIWRRNHGVIIQRAVRYLGLQNNCAVFAAPAGEWHVTAE